MRGNLIWSMRTQTAKFIEDKNGKFEIVDGQVVPFLIPPENNISTLQSINDTLKKIHREGYKERFYGGAYGLP